MGERPDLRRAFLGAQYGRPGERVRLGPCPPGRGPSWAPAGRRWAAVTAWNPGGRRAPEAHNEAAQHALRQRWPGAALHGVNGAGMWAEPALILLDAPLATAVRLGRDFAQAAILYGVGRRVALVWLDPGQVRIERYWAAPAGRPAASGAVPPTGAP